MAKAEVYDEEEELSMFESVPFKGESVKRKKKRQLKFLGRWVIGRWRVHRRRWALGLGRICRKGFFWKEYKLMEGQQRISISR